MTADEPKPADGHRLRMQRRKARVDARITAATQDRGVLLVLTGSGKGKSSSAFGMLARALGHGMHVGVVQFIKGTFNTGEEAFFRRFPEVCYHVMGEGFTWETQDRERDLRAAASAWNRSLRLLRDPQIDLLVLDELNIALKHGYLALDEVLQGVCSRPSHQHVVITGRAAPPALIEAAERLPPAAATALQVVVLYLALGSQSLRQHARPVTEALNAGDLEAARRRVGCIVSRDTGAMRSVEVARAAVESVLENGNDAVFGALLWFMIAGAPGALLYRLVNTLNAMWGYRTPRYRHFGWAAARTDDLMNFIPARLTAMSYALLGHCANALHCWRKQDPRWESPNAGPVMAAGAGSLDLELGGSAFYHGHRKMRIPLGRGAQPQASDIARALLLVDRGVLLLAGLVLAWSLSRAALQP